MSAKKTFEQREIEVLKLFKNSTVPLGSWQIANILADQGFQSSTATVGRILNKLENAGYLQQDGTHRGRLITEEGIKALAMDQHLREITAQTINLEKYIAPAMLDDFLTVLEVRRIIEGGTARLAALRATQEEILKMEELLEREEKNYRTSWINQLDVEFHKSIAKAAKNQVLEHLYMQIIGMGQQTAAFEYLRKKINAGFVSKHREILGAIKAKDEEKAEKAMLQHIDSLVGDIQTYYDYYIR
ncbi:MAG: FCD domain-containing protein [Clostridiales bacterium]